MKEKVFSFIESFIETEGYSPTQKEIMIGTGLSLYYVKKWLDELQAEGQITREYATLRSIKIVSK